MCQNSIIVRVISESGLSDSSERRTSNVNGNSARHHRHDVKYELADRRSGCYQRLINCVIVFLPTMFILPIVIYVLGRLQVITIRNVIRFESILSYYFVLSWVTMFILR